MHLRRYLTEQKITHQEAADDLGVTRQHIHRLAAGQSLPSLPLANRIMIWTDGSVTTMDLEAACDGRGGDRGH